MGIKKFGLKEAAKAGKFAKSIEQKQTVFAMLALMGVPVVIKEQAKKVLEKLAKKVIKKSKAVKELNYKAAIIEYDIDMIESKRESVADVCNGWACYNDK